MHVVYTYVCAMHYQWRDYHEEILQVSVLGVPEHGTKDIHQ